MSTFLVCRQKLIKGLGIFYLLKFWMFSLCAEFTIYLIWKLLLWKVLYVKRVCGLNLIGMRADTFISFDQFLHAGIHKGLELKKLSPRDKPRTTDTQWRHKSKISEKLGRCGIQNMLRPYLKIWDWDWIFGRAVEAISSLGVRTPCLI